MFRKDNHRLSRAEKHGCSHRLLHNSIVPTVTPQCDNRASIGWLLCIDIVCRPESTRRPTWRLDSSYVRMRQASEYSVRYRTAHVLGHVQRKHLAKALSGYQADHIDEHVVKCVHIVRNFYANNDPVA